MGLDGPALERVRWIREVVQVMTHDRGKSECQMSENESGVQVKGDAVWEVL